MSDILLATINAKYIHASLGLRYLYANLDELRDQAGLMEFTLEQRAADIAERIVAAGPRIVGLGVYIWNAEESLRLVALLKEVAPELIIVLGGPEVSHEQEAQHIVELADYVIAGQGDLAFATLCRQLLGGSPPLEKIVQAAPPPLGSVALPYRYYSDEDVAHRLIYVEASRGCPFRCEFCLSALDKTAWPFDLDRFLQEMEILYARGVRHFKFVDRTFNLNIKASRRILEFFLARLDERLFLHFEVIPDHLPDALKELLLQFPPGSLQLEIGVQSFNPEVQALISRKQDNGATEQNLRWLRENSHAHLHADLIIGLPGEDIESLGAGFNRLWSLRPHEIQVGVLKRLRGAPVARHSAAFGLRFTPQAPYTVLATSLIDFFTLQRLSRFARYWEMVANSGRFPATLPLLLDADPFGNFLAFSDWLFETTGQTHRIALTRLFDLAYQYLTGRGVSEDEVLDALARDCAVHGAKGCPGFLHERMRALDGDSPHGRTHSPERQARHLLHCANGSDCA